jgi:hypothetical protein
MKINWMSQEVTILYGYFEAKGKKSH